MADKLRGGTTIGGNIAYHAGNMGSGSNLDADKLDGQEGSYYATADSVAALAALDPVITLNGDVSGSGTMTNLGNVSITATVADDSHNHSNYLLNNSNNEFVGQLTVDNTGKLASTYTWTGSAIQTTSIEIIDANVNDETVCPTLFMHNYGDGGVKFRMGNTGDKTLYLSSGRGSDAGSPIDNNAGIYFNAIKLNGNIMWHAGNDGAGSGLDADLLDGQHGSYYLSASNLNAGTVPDARISGSYTGMTNLTGSGTVDFSKFYGNSADSVTAPSFSFTGDTNTGIYQPVADQLAITAGGVQRALFSSSGITGTLVGNASTATKLATARTINGVSFDGTANITAPTNLGITAGTTAGPIVTSSTGTNTTLPTASATASGVVTTGNQTVAGIKTFSSSPVVPTPTTDTQAVNKAYVDGKYSGFKNYIINGNFDIWQRGVSQTPSGYGSDDRWQNTNQGSTKIHSRVECTDTERALFNANYFSRTVVTSVAGEEYVTAKTQAIEDVTKLVGKTVTISFWARASSTMNIQLNIAQSYGTGGSPSVKTHNPQTPLQITSTWQKKTITVTIPSIVGKTLGTDGVHTSFTQLYFIFDAGASWVSGVTIGQQSGTFDIAQVQLEEGSVATPFEQRPIGLELSLCQRYYETGFFSVTAGTIGTGLLLTTNIVYKNTKRIPATVVYSGVVYTGCSNISTNFNSTVLVTPRINASAGGYAYAIGEYTASAEI